MDKPRGPGVDQASGAAPLTLLPAEVFWGVGRVTNS